MHLGLDVSELTFWGGLAPEGRINEPDYHAEHRLILKLIFTFLDIQSSKSDIMLPGYFVADDANIADTFSGARSALLLLGEKLSALGGHFYHFGETLFKESWQKQTFFKQGLIDRLEHFFEYSRSTTQAQARIGLEAIDQYRKDKGYDTRRTHEFEYDLVWDLQAAISSQLDRWVSLREMGVMFKGRDATGQPLGDDFFFRRVQGTPMRVRQDSLGELMLWIENPISWEHKGIEYKIELQGADLELARQAILAYNVREYQGKNVYIYNEESSNAKTERIFQALLIAYSKHPAINKGFNKKGITFRQLFEGTIGKYRTFHRYYKEGKPLTERLCRHILFQAHKDALHLYVPLEFRSLLKAISQQIPHWWILNRDDRLHEIITNYHESITTVAANLKKLRSQPELVDYVDSMISNSPFKTIFSITDEDCSKLIDLGLDQYYSLLESLSMDSRKIKAPPKRMSSVEKGECVFCGKFFKSENALEAHLKLCKLAPDDQRTLKSLK